MVAEGGAAAEGSGTEARSADHSMRSVEKKIFNFIWSYQDGFL